MKTLNLSLNGKTAVYGIIGNPVAHSFSPWMQSWFFRKQKINAVYCPFEVNDTDLRKAVNGLKALNIQGFNVTVPYKEKVMPYLDKVSSEAKIIGAVNTVVRKEDHFEGFNTDGYGFLKSLVTQGEVLPDGASFLIFGLGGAARSIVYTLAKEKARQITISSRKKTRAAAFCKEVNQYAEEKLCLAVESYSSTFEEKLAAADVIVNCSPLGMKPEDPLPFSPEKCKKGAVIYDLIYNPARTPLLKKARQNGLSVINGLGMLIFQGMKSFKHWTQEDVTIYFDTIYRELGKNIEG